MSSGTPRRVEFWRLPGDEDERAGVADMLINPRHEPTIAMGGMSGRFSHSGLFDRAAAPAQRLASAHADERARPAEWWGSGSTRPALGGRLNRELTRQGAVPLCLPRQISRSA